MATASDETMTSHGGAAENVAKIYKVHKTKMWRKYTMLQFSIDLNVAKIYKIRKNNNMWQKYTKFTFFILWQSLLFAELLDDSQSKLQLP